MCVHVRVCVCVCVQLVGEKQQELQVNSMQLLYYQAPLSALLLVFIIPFFEPLDAYHGVLYSWPFETLVRVAVSSRHLDSLTC